MLFRVSYTPDSSLVYGTSEDDGDGDYDENVLCYNAGFEGQSGSYNQTQQSNRGPERKDNIHHNSLN